MSPEVFAGHRNVIQGEHHDIGVMLVREVLDNGERVPHGNTQGQPGMLQEVLWDAYDLPG